MLKWPIATQNQKVFETCIGTYAHLHVYISVLAYQEDINSMYIPYRKDLKKNPFLPIR